ncbi:hypothetical protein K2F43_05390 [Clostridium estertheticum]|nr:hypothetical protein [Clostridium estertheticum]MBW9170637.1 hypothetical protein [Clostridium estertheticum]
MKSKKLIILNIFRKSIKLLFRVTKYKVVEEDLLLMKQRSYKITSKIKQIS